jgi:hypothetical protein
MAVRSEVDLLDRGVPGTDASGNILAGFEVDHIAATSFSS